MTTFCDNQYCEHPGVKAVPVSVREPSDQVRTLCASCEEADTWGVQHGTMTSQKMQLWIVAVADRGLVAHAHAYPDEDAARNGLAGYLRKYHGYKASNNQETIEDWLKSHDENLSVEVVCQDSLLKQPHHVQDKPTVTHIDRFLQKDSFVVLTRNNSDPSPDSPFEAWAYEGPLNFQSATPVTFGIGRSVSEALDALNFQLIRAGK